MITPALRRAFLDHCRRRGIEPARALEMAIADLLAQDGDGRPRTLRGRPAMPPRKLSAQLVQAARLRTADSLQFSKRNLADAIGVHPSHLSKWLGGHAVPRTDDADQSVATLCDLLGVGRDCAFAEQPVDAPTEQVAA